jgi:hypothetical protein
MRGKEKIKDKNNKKGEGEKSGMREKGEKGEKKKEKKSNNKTSTANLKVGG